MVWMLNFCGIKFWCISLGFLYIIIYEVLYICCLSIIYLVLGYWILEYQLVSINSMPDNWSKYQLHEYGQHDDYTFINL